MRPILPVAGGHAAGKLGAVHFQFAPSITSGGEPRRLVEHCARVMGGTVELAEIAGRVIELAQAVPVVHAVMNNNYEDQGQRNAKTLAGLLDNADS